MRLMIRQTQKRQFICIGINVILLLVMMKVHSFSQRTQHLFSTIGMTPVRSSTTSTVHRPFIQNRATSAWLTPSLTKQRERHVQKAHISTTYSCRRPDTTVMFSGRTLSIQSNDHHHSMENVQDVDDNVFQKEEGDATWKEDDTIYALSSGSIGAQATAVAVIRISGPRAHQMLEQLLLLDPTKSDTSSISSPVSRPSRQQKLPPPRKAAVRTLYDPVTHSPLDQALVLRFDAPHSFTGEDVVELHCHGSRAVLSGVLEALAACRIPQQQQNSNHHHNIPTPRLAEPGEFTQRAMFHGKLDLLQVEALADLLSADTQRQRQQALQQLQPGEHQLSRLYSEWRSTLISGLAHAEAVIDFGDDEHLDHDDHDDDHLGDDHYNRFDGQWNVWGKVADKMHQLWLDMQHHLKDGRRGELVRTGIKVAIVGPPNAGKSSLFNVLAQRDAAIVSPQAGTTRDVLELTLDLAGVKCMLSDTAGLRESTTDLIEQEGMKRARHTAQHADIVLAVVDMTNPMDGLQALQDAIVQPPASRDDDHQESSDISTTSDDDDDNQQKVMLVLNKLDLKPSSAATTATADVGLGDFSFAQTCAISCETNEGIDNFLEALTKLVVSRIAGDDINPKKPNGSKPQKQQQQEEGAMITRARHRQHVEAAAAALSRFYTLSQQGSMAVDLAAEELRLAASELGRITGAVDVEDVLDVLFRDFCIGK